MTRTDHNPALLVIQSILDMSAHAKNRDRASVAIIGGMGDQLVIGGQYESFGDIYVVIGFDNVLRTIMGQLSVANEDSKPARREVSPCAIRQPIRHRGKTENILGSSPGGPFPR